ncbi:MAG TPA: hypothetical protein VFI31_25290 [Pirellulales bacterium]|nr:hypothetical protein [Pirellulales bacterium]
MELLQTLENLGRLLELAEWREFVFDLLPVESGFLANQYSLDVSPILRAIGEGLQHHKILSGCRAE